LQNSCGKKPFQYGHHMLHFKTLALRKYTGSFLHNSYIS
jgi:hypothetical protein